MNWKHWASIAGSTFAGVAAGYVQAHVAADGLPSTKAQATSMAIGAGVAGVVAVAHLFQPKPGQS